MGKVVRIVEPAEVEDQPSSIRRQLITLGNLARAGRCLTVAACKSNGEAYVHCNRVAQTTVLIANV